MSIIGSTNILHSGSQTGQPQDNKQSVTDAVTDLTPWQVPFLAMINRGTAPTARVHQWRCDHGGSRPTTTTDVTSTFNEGDDYTNEGIDNHFFLKNNLHLFAKIFSISHTMEDLQEWGIDSRIDYETVKASRKLIRDVCFMIMRSALDEQSAGPNSNSTNKKRMMGGLRSMITSLSAGATTHVANGTVATAARPYAAHITNDLSASAGLLRVQDINTMLGTLWDRGGVDGDMIYALANKGPKRYVSELFAPNQGSSSIFRKTIGAGVQPINLKVDIIETEFCDVHMMLDWTVKDSAAGTASTTGDDEGDLLFFDPSALYLKTLRDFVLFELAKVGSSNKYAVEWEGTLEWDRPNGAGLLQGILGAAS